MFLCVLDNKLWNLGKSHIILIMCQLNSLFVRVVCKIRLVLLVYQRRKHELWNDVNIFEICRQEKQSFSWTCHELLSKENHTLECLKQHNSPFWERLWICHSSYRLWTTRTKNHNKSFWEQKLARKVLRASQYFIFLFRFVEWRM